MALIIALLLAVFVVWCVIRLRPLIEKKRRMGIVAASVNGPPTIPILGNALQINSHPVEFVKYILPLANEMAEKGEDVFRLWIGESLLVIPLNGQALKAILESTTEIVKGVDYDFFRPWFGDGLLTSTGSKWKARRKLLTPAFHFNMLKRFIPIFVEESKVLVSELSKFAECGKEVDLQPLMKRCALDIICGTAMGVKVNAQRGQNTEYVDAVAEMSYLGFEKSMNAWFKMYPIWYATGRAQRAHHAVRVLTNFTNKVVEERRALPRKEDSDKSAFLDLLLDMEKEGHIDDEQIKDEVNTFLFAGHDTTAANLGWTLWCLAKHPDVQQRAIEEVDSVLGKCEGNITLADLNELKYLECCIKETLRLFPSVPFVQRQLQNDLQIGDKTLPAGANCSISPLIVHRNRKIFPNADKFDVDNFLSQERVTQRHPYSYIPFSAGPRNCIGQKFALLEEKTVIAWILRSFTLSSQMAFEENRCATLVILNPEHGLPISLHKRSH